MNYGPRKGQDLLLKVPTEKTGLRRRFFLNGVLLRGPGINAGHPIWQLFDNHLKKDVFIGSTTTTTKNYIKIKIQICLAEKVYSLKTKGNNRDTGITKRLGWDT